MKFFVIMACHNRKELTVRSVEQAQAAADYASVEISFTIFDDGSTDGTAEALADMPQSIQVLRGDGSAFWARGMAQAESAVLGDGLAARDESVDIFLVWLNDDVLLDGTAFLRLRNIIETHQRTIVVAAMRDAETGSVTYSGLRRRGLHPLGFELALPAELPQPVETFNGNLVIVPIAIARLLGGIDGGFSHAMADIDYGLRCGRARIPVLLAPGTHGTCARNLAGPRQTTFQDWRVFVGLKGGGNYSSLKRILRKSNRFTWLVVVTVTYVLWWLRRSLKMAPWASEGGR